MVPIIRGFFFFKQKTAYEMQRSLVGSEMCIRDRYRGSKGVRNRYFTSFGVVVQKGFQ